MDGPGRGFAIYRWLIFSIMAIAYVGAFFHRGAPAVVALDIQESFGISAGLMGLLASAYFYSYAVVQFPAGLLSDSLGPRKTVSLFLIVGGVGSILFGLAPFLELSILGRVLVGLGAGMVFTPNMKILSEWFRVREFSRMNGLFLASGGLGALTAAAPLALVAGWVGWQISFAAIGCATLILAALVWLLVRDRPQDLGYPSLSQTDSSSARALPPTRAIPLRQGVRLVLTNPYFWPLAIWSFLSIGCNMAFGGLWAGPYLRHVYGLSRTEAGNVLNMLAVGIMVGSPLMSVASERIFMSRKKVLMISAAILVSAVTVLNLFPSGLPLVALYLVILVFSMFSIPPAVMSITSTKELFPLEITGTSVGTVNLFPFVGAAAMQLGMGWALDSYGGSGAAGYSVEAYSVVLKILWCAAFGALLCTFFMKETFPGYKRHD